MIKLQNLLLFLPLMLLAGCIFGFVQQWIYAALVWVGAFGCMVAALNPKNQKR